jgi:hypothetical protein
MKWIACVIRAAAGFNARTFGAPNQERRVSMGICKRRPRRPGQGGISLPKQFRDLGGGLVAEEGNWVAGISYKIVLGRARLSEAAEKNSDFGWRGALRLRSEPALSLSKGQAFQRCDKALFDQGFSPCGMRSGFVSGHGFSRAATGQ